MYDYDSGLLYMGLADAQKFFGLGNAITGVEIRVTDLYGAEKVARQLEQTLGTPFRARDWMEVNRNLFLAVQAREGRLLHRADADRARRRLQHRRDADHGRDGKAQGHRDPQVDGRDRSEHRPHLHVEGADHRRRRHRCSASSADTPAAGLLARYQFVELPKDVFYVSTLPVRVYGENFATVALVSVVICLLATIYPARQAAGLAPVEVIRYE
jgi:lipoprotein-releasing system permease protein